MYLYSIFLVSTRCCNATITKYKRNTNIQELRTLLNPLLMTCIVFQVEEISLNDTDSDMLSGVEEEEAEISIPREVLEGLGNGEPVRMASLLFRNKSGLLPERLEGNNNDGLA